MAEAAKEILQSFALHLQLSASECEDASAVAQRYLAIHVNVVPTIGAYANIADDFRVVELRTHNPPINVYSQKGVIDVPTFVYLMSSIPNDTKKPKRMEAFSQFVDEFFPRIQGEERWKQISRPNQWKEKATFLALNFKDYKLMEAIHGKESAPDIHQRLRAYNVKQKLKPDELLNDINTIIKQVTVPAHDMVLLAKNQMGAPVADVDVAPTTFVKEVVPLKKVLIINTSTPTKTLEELRPRMEAYRKRAGINATVSTARIAKQMLYAALGTPLEKVPPAILGTFQKSITPLAGEEEIATALDAIQAFPHVEMDANASAYLVALAAVCKRYEWDSRSLLVHAMCPSDVLDCRAHARLTKTCPEGAAKDTIVIATIQNMK